MFPCRCAALVDQSLPRDKVVSLAHFSGKSQILHAVVVGATLLLFTAAVIRLHCISVPSGACFSVRALQNTEERLQVHHCLTRDSLGPQQPELRSLPVPHSCHFFMQSVQANCFLQRYTRTLPLLPQKFLQAIVNVVNVKNQTLVETSPAPMVLCTCLWLKSQ